MIAFAMSYHWLGSPVSLSFAQYGLPMRRIILGVIQIRKQNDALKHMRLICTICFSLLVTTDWWLCIFFTLHRTRIMNMLQKRRMQKGIALTSVNAIQGRTKFSKYVNGSGSPHTLEIVILPSVESTVNVAGPRVKNT